MTKKYKVGDKVVPIAKTHGIAWKECEEWEKAQTSGQNFLYLAGNDRAEYYALAFMENGQRRNYYREEDLIPYEEESDEEFYFEVKADMLARMINQGIINGNDIITFKVASIKG